MKILRPVIFLASMLLIVGLACSTSGGGGTEPPQQEPTQIIEATNAPVDVSPTEAPPVVPTNTTAPKVAPVSEFFTQEFDKDPLWDYFLTYGDEDNVTVEFSDSLMIFTLDDLDTYAYYIYEDVEYTDVRVDIRANNRGRNNNNISLVCRYSDDGWYEFSTEGGGLWYLYAAVPGSNGDIQYNIVDQGGAKSLKQGKEINEYTMTCQGDEIKLAINGVDIKTVRDTKYALRDGNVGFNISSLNVTPIIVEVDWFKVSEP